MIVEINDGQVRWHGLTNAEHAALWAREKWVPHVVRTLRQALWDDDASAEDRLMALHLLN